LYVSFSNHSIGKRHRFRLLHRNIFASRSPTTRNPAWLPC